MPIDEEDVRNVLQKTQALNWTIDVLRDFCHIEMEFSQFNSRCLNSQGPTKTSGPDSIKGRLLSIIFDYVVFHLFNFVSSLYDLHQRLV